MNELLPDGPLMQWLLDGRLWRANWRLLRGVLVPYEYEEPAPGIVVWRFTASGVVPISFGAS